jgi:hypothetical protein
LTRRLPRAPRFPTSLETIHTFGLSTRVILQNLLQNRIFLPPHQDSLLYISFPRINHPSSTSFVPTTTRGAHSSSSPFPSPPPPPSLSPTPPAPPPVPLLPPRRRMEAQERGARPARPPPPGAGRARPRRARPPSLPPPARPPIHAAAGAPAHPCLRRRAAPCLFRRAHISPSSSGLELRARIEKADELVAAELEARAGRAGPTPPTPVQSSSPGTGPELLLLGAPPPVDAAGELLLLGAPPPNRAWRRTGVLRQSSRGFRARARGRWQRRQRDVWWGRRS